MRWLLSKWGGMRNEDDEKEMMPLGLFLVLERHALLFFPFHPTMHLNVAQHSVFIALQQKHNT